MLSILLKSKIHGATVTDAQMDYEGSLTIDKSLMDVVGILSYEKILVANMANGERFETYAIPADPGSGVICLNGATAHKGQVGDRLIIFTFGLFTPEEVPGHAPKVTRPDARNRVRPGE
jgi:aspartate 1-decarboxylase